MRSLWDYATSALLAVGILLLAAGSASAQTLVNPGQKPEVEVDTSVLDHLGEVPTLPDLFLGRRPPGQPSAQASARTFPQAIPSTVTPRLASIHRPHQLRQKAVRSTRTAIGKSKQARHSAKPAKTAAQPAAKAALAAAPAKPAATPTPTPIAPSAAEAPARAAAAPASEPDLKPLPQPAAAETPAPEAKPAAETPPAPEVKPPAETKPAAEARTAEAAPAPAPAEPAAKLPPVNLPAAVPEPAKPAPAESRVQTSLNASAPPAPQLAARPATPLPSTAPPAPPASLTPPADAPLVDGTATIPFERDDARLPDDARKSLARLAGRMADDNTLQVQLLAYAEGNEDNASKARRLSLSRALAVRSFLIDQGVRSTRIEVRALGNKVLEGAPDRVDILVQKR